MFWTILILGTVSYLAWRLLTSEACSSSPLDKLPGPRMYPILGNAYPFLGSTPKTLFLLARKFHRRYGDRFIIKAFSRRILHITHPDDIELVLSHSKNIMKSKPYTFLGPWLGSGLLLSSGSLWHKRRKILTPAFHFNILRNFAGIIEEKTQGLVQSLQQNPLPDNLMPVISNYTLHTICETAMGTQLDVDKSKASIEYKNAILKMGGCLLARLTRTWLHSDFIFFMTQRGKTLRKYLKTIHSFSDNVIMERKQQMKDNDTDITEAALEGEIFVGKKRLAMLDLLLTAEKNGEIDLAGIKDEVSTFMFEGHDTTAMAITFGLMVLSKHKHVQDKMYEEYKSIFGDSTRIASFNDLNDMQYTNAVIKEILRVCPSVPFIGRTITEGFFMDDIYVKAGTEVAIHIYDVHRRPELFPEPEKFDPERFLEADTNRHPFAFIPFSAGPRNCIGQRFAMQEMKCVFSEIIRAFVLESVGEPPGMLADLVLRPAGPIQVKFVKR